jgi:hypothetical protein
MRRLRPLSEAECYARCYGARDLGVKIVRVIPRFRRSTPSLVSGEELRRSFELRLDAREPEAA